MDQDQNNNLFLNNEPPREPEQPRSDEPVYPSGGAQVYPPVSGPETLPPAEPAYVPPPPYSAPPAAQPPKSNRTIWIVVIVAVVLLCCCCLSLVLFWLWNNGDQLIEEFSWIAPVAAQFLA